jgi:hypothetical protein
MVNRVEVLIIGGSIVDLVKGLRTLKARPLLTLIEKEPRLA